MGWPLGSELSAWAQSGEAGQGPELKSEEAGGWTVAAAAVVAAAAGQPAAGLGAVTGSVAFAAHPSL